MMSYDAIGVIEARYFATALEMTDAMSKAAQVEWLASENYLGGKLVTVVVGGDIANVKAAVEAAEAVCAGKADNPLANAAVILKPHAEIMKFIVPSSGQELDKMAAEEMALPKEQKMAVERQQAQPDVAGNENITASSSKTDEMDAKPNTKSKASRPAASEKKNMKEEK
ncbi:BMC domain-containing protein [Paenibacillus sp. OSY-SE]|uniref:BMC domain-containing protein n=1 Tax=Paenibacillus sp. OSY-SE TaxID=1196323 RepID=UPI0002F4DCF7|nr:BMC domain-containing protein [Paenibacillus sp. OSY-SE]